MSRCGFWAGLRGGVQTHALGVYAALSSYMGWAVNPLQTSPLHAHYLCGQLEMQPQRDAANFSWLVLPKSRRSWCRLSKSLCCFLCSELGSDQLLLSIWCCSSDSDHLGYQLTISIHSSCCPWASCAYLCIPVYATGLSLHFGKCFVFGCKGLTLELCKALKGEEKTHLFHWARKLWGNDRYCSVSAQSLCSCRWVLESWPDPVYEVLQVLSQPLLELCSPCTNNDWLGGMWAQTSVSQIPGHL